MQINNMIDLESSKSNKEVLNADPRDLHNYV